MGKTRRREYTGPKAIDKTCRCHGGCPWCLGNRTIRDRRILQDDDDTDLDGDDQAD